MSKQVFVVKESTSYPPAKRGHENGLLNSVLKQASLCPRNHLVPPIYKLGIWVGLISWLI